MIWELCLEETQKNAKSLQDSVGRPQKRGWQVKPGQDEDLPLEQRQTKLRLFARRSAVIVLSIGLLKYYNHFDDTRTRQCSEIMKNTIRDVKKVCINEIMAAMEVKWFYG